jgi:hypothetical protein
MMVIGGGNVFLFLFARACRGDRRGAGTMTSRGQSKHPRVVECKTKERKRKPGRDYRLGRCRCFVFDVCSTGSRGWQAG